MVIEKNREKGKRPEHPRPLKSAPAEIRATCSRWSGAMACAADCAIDMPMNDEKLRQIETTLAHQDLQIQDLSEMVTRQWKEIERLKRQLDQAQEKLNTFEAAAAEGQKPLSVTEAAALEKPPHY